MDWKDQCLKMFICSKSIYNSSGMPTKIRADFGGRNRKSNSNIFTEIRGPRSAKIILK